MSQSNTDPNFYQGQIPSAPQWDGYFHQKIDAANGYSVNQQLDECVINAGSVMLAADPVHPLEAVTKQYVDGLVLGSGGYVDAPHDGKSYGRNNSTWIQVIGSNNDVVDGGNF